MNNYDMNELDITYYESLLEMVQEEQKIHEMLNISKYSHVLEGFDQDQIAIYENKVIDIIMEAISGIIGKVLEHIQKVTSFIKGDKFVPDNKLIAACEAKMKAMSTEDRDSFILKEVNPIPNINKTCQLLDDYYLMSSALYIKMTESFTQFSNNENAEKNSKLIEDINSLIENYKSKTKLDEIKIESFEKVDVSFNDIKVLINDHKKLKDTANTLNKNLSISEKNVDDSKKKIDDMMKSKKVKEDPNHLMNAYRSTYAELSSFMMAAKRKHLELFTYSCRMEESILRKFVGFGTMSTSNESVEYFDKVLESMMYEETEEEVIL